MPILTVITENKTRQITFKSGTSVRQILEKEGIWIRSGCRGNGACGLCRIKVEQGNIDRASPIELVVLSANDLNHSIRLACQLFPENDLRIRNLNEVSKNQWHDLSADYLISTPSSLAGFPKDGLMPKAYGLAVDLGTTNICLSVWDLNQGKRLAARTGLNPQFQYGSDVITRMTAAAESAENARNIARLPLDAVRGALLDLCLRDHLNAEDIVAIGIVGNTAMMVLLTGTDPRPLLQPGNWTNRIDCQPGDFDAWVKLLEVNPEADIEVISPLAGFVGSDLLAGAIATGMLEHRGNLLIDFGTNSEMALWDGTTLWVTSAAGGPAFEGCGIKCGMPAEPGAIYRIQARQGFKEPDFHVIGGGEPRGFCGSGLIDLIALLRHAGNLTPTGKFTNTDSAEGPEISNFNPDLRLSKGDVDLFQRAKAAIGVGIKTLLSKAEMDMQELNRVYISGAFGLHLNIDNAQYIGLLPEIPARRFQLCGNTALAGVEQLLLLPEKQTELDYIRQTASIINLSNIPDFETAFLNNLYLQPQKAERR
jgi:uncharacterized 2Fe-2S/4Fe-4S cluster protein (DUF4445 family)